MYGEKINTSLSSSHIWHCPLTLNRTRLLNESEILDRPFTSDNMRFMWGQFFLGSTMKPSMGSSLIPWGSSLICSIVWIVFSEQREVRSWRTKWEYSSIPVPYSVTVLNIQFEYILGVRDWENCSIIMGARFFLLNFDQNPPGQH